jgi:type II secretory pathway pseudopilin PulG
MRSRTGFTYTELLCVLTVIALVWVMILPGLTRAKLRGEETNCALRLRNISWALRMYAQDHYGHMPPESAGLPALVPRYLHDYDVFQCPTVAAREKLWRGEVEPPGPGTVDYAYQPGLGADDRPSEAVVWDNAPRHRDGGNVVYLSGRVIWVDAAELERIGGSTTAAGGATR